jgi:hypothetical protein
LCITLLELRAPGRRIAQDDARGQPRERHGDGGANVSISAWQPAGELCLQEKVSTAPTCWIVIVS